MKLNGCMKLIKLKTGSTIGNGNGSGSGYGKQERKITDYKIKYDKTESKINIFEI